MANSQKPRRPTKETVELVATKKQLKKRSQTTTTRTFAVDMRRQAPISSERNAERGELGAQPSTSTRPRLVSASRIRRAATATACPSSMQGPITRAEPKAPDIGREAATRNQQVADALRQKTAIGDRVPGAALEKAPEGLAAADVALDGPGGATDPVLELPRPEHVVLGERVLPDDPARLADPQARGAVGQERLGEAGHLPAKELRQPGAWLRPSISAQVSSSASVAFTGRPDELESGERHQDLSRSSRRDQVSALARKTVALEVRLEDLRQPGEVREWPRRHPRSAW